MKHINQNVSIKDADSFLQILIKTSDEQIQTRLPYTPHVYEHNISKGSKYLYVE